LDRKILDEADFKPVLTEKKKTCQSPFQLHTEGRSRVALSETRSETSNQ